MARKTKLTNQVQEAMVAALKMGATYRLAAEAAGARFTHG
jgi:hypothetical protein